MPESTVDVSIVGCDGGFSLLCWFILGKAYVGMVGAWNYEQADDARATQRRVLLTKGERRWNSWAVHVAIELITQCYSHGPQVVDGADPSDPL